MQINKANIFLILVAGFLLGFYFWPNAKQQEEQGQPLVSIVLPELSQQAVAGQKAFQENCAACHGENAVGRNKLGPPLIHIIYEPSHHGDQSFYLAAKNGVRAHHWTFGNMPKIEGVADKQLQDIVYFVREVQRANGIK